MEETGRDHAMAASHLYAGAQLGRWQPQGGDGAGRGTRGLHIHRRPFPWPGFLPKLEEGNLWIRATLPATISLEEGNSYVNEMRKLIGRAAGGRVGGFAAWPSR